MITLKRYKMVLILLVISGLLWLWDPAVGTEITARTGHNFLDMLGVLPPIFILLGLLEVWVPREVIIRNLGDTSGIRGITLSILLGSAAAGPLYVAFPVAVAMLKKGARFANIVIFLFSWSTLKIPLLLFEASALGWSFTLARAGVNIPAIILMGLLVDRLISSKEKEALRQHQLAMETEQAMGAAQ
ncbi:permease [Dethiobacter alkaliphilus]|uniref:permease n=1 Tax=Dethiobacter alkaliphilus TaxID=427926 RepID=UPI0022264B30|nr:permease [Dethiobacter alkaliphilus]MCW3489647.1 permease [Dethiobacter alkaliphilus]